MVHELVTRIHSFHMRISARRCDSNPQLTPLLMVVNQTPTEEQIKESSCLGTTWLLGPSIARHFCWQHPQAAKNLNRIGDHPWRTLEMAETTSEAEATESVLVVARE